jgi:hypothetical protein
MNKAYINFFTEKLKKKTLWIRFSKKKLELIKSRKSKKEEQEVLKKKSAEKSEKEKKQDLAATSSGCAAPSGGSHIQRQEREREEMKRAVQSCRWEVEAGCLWI